MSLRTRFSNLANILEKDSQNENVLVLDSPVLSCAAWERLKGSFGDAVAVIDCTMTSTGGAIELRDALARIRSEAEKAVRQGKTEIFLTDEDIDEDRMAISHGHRHRRRAHPSGASRG